MYSRQEKAWAIDLAIQAQRGEKGIADAEKTFDLASSILDFVGPEKETVAEEVESEIVDE